MAAFIDEDMNIPYFDTFVFNASIETVEYPAVILNFFFTKWEIFVMYCWFVYFMFWNSVLGVAASPSLFVLVEFEAFSWSHCFQESELWAVSCRQTWERSTSGFWVVRTSLLVPVWSPCPSSSFPGLTGYPSRSTGCVTRSWRVSPSVEPWVLASPSVNLHWKSFLGLSLTWCSAFRSDQKENCWNGCREHRETHYIKQTEKMIPLVTRRTLFGWDVSKLFFVSTCLIWISCSKLILSNNQSSATLWVLDTCLIVGLLPLVIISITVSLSSKICNWASHWEELAFVTTWSTCANSSTSRLPLKFWVGISQAASRCLLGWCLCILRGM